MPYYHGVRIEEIPTSLPSPVIGTSGLQVVFGTAPINLAKDLSRVSNAPILAYSFADAAMALGYCDDFKNYTICQSMDACFRAFSVSPVVFINVLDPIKHKTALAETECNITDKQAIITEQGILLDSLIVKNGATEMVRDTDYLASFNETGNAVITLLTTDTITKVLVSGSKIDPSKVSETDIIGGYDIVTGKETGLELIRQIYPMFGFAPGIIIAPGWSQKPNVAAAIAAKCININGCFTSEAIVDIDCTVTGAAKYTGVESVKEKSGLISPHVEPVWPKVKIGEKIYYYSAVFAASIAYADAINGDVPSLPVSNKTLPITAICLDDSVNTEIILDREQANVVNSYGVVTAINQNGFRTWGNNTAAYPRVTDPKDRWFNCRRFFSWWGNSFIITYFDRVDNPADYRLIETICDEENIRGNSLMAQGKCAGARMEYRADENPVEDIVNGKIQFHQYLAPYTPAEDIYNVLEFDPSILATALSGGEG